MLGDLVSHLAERLSGDADGKPKAFRDSSVEILTEFFQRFSRLNVRSNDELQALVDEAQAMVGGVRPQQLRDSSTLRDQIAGELAHMQTSLDGLMVDRPRRSILRRAK